MELKGIKGKNVLVTGASVGIGKAIAIEFAKEGANVAINYNSTLDRAEDTEKICKNTHPEGKFMTVKCNVAKEDEVLNMIETTIETLGSIDILINNAAIQSNIPSHERTLEKHKLILDVNLNGPFVASREVIKHFLKREYPGIIINISSPHELIPKPGFLSYSASKGGLYNLTRTLALEYARKGIRVCAVSPGATLTRINSAWKNDPAARKAVEDNIPLGYAAEPEDISPTVVFLASKQARYITGCTTHVDGGALLYPTYMKNWSS